MCDQCNYYQMLSDAGLNPTSHRIHIMEVIGGHTSPLNAQDIF